MDFEERFNATASFKEAMSASSSSGGSASDKSVGESMMSEGSLLLPLDPLLALQLQEMFGPVKMHPSALSAGLVPHEDYVVKINFEFAKQLYRCWEKTLEEKADSHQKEIDEMIKADEALARELQEEEESKNKKKKFWTPGTFDNASSGSDSSSSSGASPLFGRRRYTPTKRISATRTASHSFGQEQGFRLHREAKLDELTEPNLEDEEETFTQEDRATKLKREKLQEMFPRLDAEALENIFAANNYKFDPTVEQIEASLLTFDPSPVISTSNLTLRSKALLPDPEPLPAALRIPEPSDTRVPGLPHIPAHSETRFRKPSPPPSADEDSSSSDEDETERRRDSGLYQTMNDPQYRDYRAEANLHYQMRQEYFQKASKAFSRGEKHLSEVYKQQGLVHEEKMKAEHKRAADMILQQHNACQDENTLDLHGLHVEEALDALEEILKQKETEEADYPGMRRFSPLTVITGRGSHSRGGKSKLRPAVMNWLDRNNYRFTKATVGTLQVYLK